MTLDTRLAPAPVEVVTPIRPSEAIRLGCLTTSQNFGNYGVGEFACALKAMGVGYGDGSQPWDRKQHPAYPAGALTLEDGCPAGCVERDTRRLIPHLNDDHRWSRERIADWLQGIGL